MKNLYVSGYRNYELGIFNDDDQKLYYIKKALKQAILRYLDEGLEWVLMSGELGIETWAGQVVNELREDYPNLKYAVIMPYEQFGEKWSEKNSLSHKKLLADADYVDYSSKMPYDNPGQLVANQAFLINSSSGALLLYEPEFKGKTEYLYDLILQKQEKSDYLLEFITQFDLQDIVDQEQFEQ